MIELDRCAFEAVLRQVASQATPAEHDAIYEDYLKLQELLRRLRGIAVDDSASAAFHAPPRFDGAPESR